MNEIPGQAATTLLRRRSLKARAKSKARRFHLVRHVDVSGISGTGIVAEGIEWSDGTVALRWCGQYPTTTVWQDGIPALLAIHGHHGSTTIHWLDP